MQGILHTFLSDAWNFESDKQPTSVARIYEGYENSKATKAICQMNCRAQYQCVQGSFAEREQGRRGRGQLAALPTLPSAS